MTASIFIQTAMFCVVLWWLILLLPKAAKETYEVIDFKESRRANGFYDDGAMINPTSFDDIQIEQNKEAN